MSELLSSVSQQLLAPGGLELDSLPGILHELNGPGIDAADLYFQSQVSESWMLEDGIVKEGSFNLDQGVGVRAQSGEKTGFAYSNAITAEALKQAAVAARSISRAGQNGSVQAFKAVVPARLYAGENPLDVLSRAEKVELLKQIDAATRALDPRIQQVTVSMAGVWEQILVAGGAAWPGAARPPGPAARGGPTAVAVAPTIAISSRRIVPWATPARPCARHWSTSRRFPRRPAPCRW